MSRESWVTVPSILKGGELFKGMGHWDHPRAVWSTICACKSKTQLLRYFSTRSSFSIPQGFFFLKTIYYFYFIWIFLKALPFVQNIKKIKSDVGVSTFISMFWIMYFQRVSYSSSFVYGWLCKILKKKSKCYFSTKSFKSIEINVKEGLRIMSALTMEILAVYLLP